VDQRTRQDVLVTRPQLVFGRTAVRCAAVLLTLLLAAIPLSARKKDALQYGAGLIMNVPFPESEVAQVVEDVAQSGIIRGTKEYNKDEYIAGAVGANSTKVFPEKAEPGERVFYKIRLKTLDPRNFKDSGDIGTLAVRYVLKAQDGQHTIIRIDARFVEDFRRTVHVSNGSVESEEYKVIHDHLEELQLAKAEAREVEKNNDAERERKAQQAKAEASVSQQKSDLTNAPKAQAAPVLANVSNAATAGGTVLPAATANAPALTDARAQTVEQRVKDLRQQVERRVKAPGAPLKSAPFRTASNLQSLAAGTEVLIVVSTTYWLGVETHDGQHGWMLRDELEPVE
jgi:hypothetical protein